MPLKKVKPAAKGPFFFFMLEFRRKEEAAGYQFTGGMDEVMKRAGPHWDKLAPYEREPYNQKAKAYKAHPKDLVGERYTAQGVPFSQVEAEARARRAKEESIQREIVEMIQKAATGNALEDLEVVLIACNYFCLNSTGDYVPAEVAMVKYSLADGIKDKINILINPKELPMGMAHDAEFHSTETHQLPLPPDALGETDYEVVVEKIFQFTGGSRSKKRLPPVFTFNKEREMVESILDGFLDTVGMDDVPLKVYPLFEFFFLLKRATESYGLDISTFPSIHMAKALLEKDVYAYTMGIGCEKHEELGNSINCALSKCIRWAYTISDCCCLDIGVEMERGKHLPENMSIISDFTESVSCISSRMSRVTLSAADQTACTSSSVVRKGSRSRERGPNGEVTNTTIYSTRTVSAAQISIATSKERKPASEYPSLAESFNATNPFRVMDQPTSTDTKTESVAVETAPIKRNPWSREGKLAQIIRGPNGIEGGPTVLQGRGRGTLASIVAGRGYTGAIETPLKVGGRGRKENI